MATVITNSSALGDGDVLTIANELLDVAPRWELLARCLKLSVSDIANIRTKYGEEVNLALSAVISRAIATRHQLTWSDLVQALREPMLNEECCASQIEKKFVHKLTPHRPPAEIPKYNESEAEIDVDPVPDGCKLKELQSYAKDVKLILHTVNDKEITAVLSKLQPPDIDGFEKPISFDAIPFKIVLGTFGGYRVAQVNTEMGTECEKDLKEALTQLPNARAVIAVGVAYGSDREKYKFGDVLVSKVMHSVKNIRLQPDEIINRPNNLSTVPVADYLSGIFTKGTITWNKKFQCNKTTDSDSKPRYAQVHCGSIISAPMLVADAKSRDKLLRNYPSGAIGGEMEGGVLLEIQNKHNADRARHHDLGVIIIKGVGDFGDDQKQEGKKWQYTASLAAASYIEHKLNMTGGRLFTETEPKNPED